MRNNIDYEWCVETCTKDGEDIINNNYSNNDTICFQQIAFECNEDEFTRLVLVRSEGNEIDGLVDRVWAYVKAGVLPEYFEDERGYSINIKVPQKYHKQLSKYYESKN